VCVRVRVHARARARARARACTVEVVLFKMKTAFDRYVSGNTSHSE